MIPSVFVFLAAVVVGTSSWCADRVVGENERGRYAITYLWEGEPQADGTALCHPLGDCARTDTTGDDQTGGPDFRLLLNCIGESASDHIPPTE